MFDLAQSDAIYSHEILPTIQYKPQNHKKIPAKIEEAPFLPVSIKETPIQSFSSLVRARKEELIIYQKTEETIPTGPFVGSYLHEIFKELFLNTQCVQDITALTTFIQNKPQVF